MGKVKKNRAKNRKAKAASPAAPPAGMEMEISDGCGGSTDAPKLIQDVRLRGEMLGVCTLTSVIIVAFECAAVMQGVCLCGIGGGVWEVRAC